MHKHVSRNRAHGFGFSAYHGKYAAKRPNPVVRTLCMVLTCVIAMSLLVSGIAYQGAYAATAASGQCGADMWWEFEGSTGILTIEGQGAMWDFEDPEDAPWAGFAGSIRRIVFLSGVTVIGKNAFVGCSVKTVAFPDTLTVIRENAFLNCGKLAEVDVSQTQLVSVEAKAFSGCQELRMEAVSLPESVIFVDETAFDKEPTEPTEEPTEPAEEPTEPVEEPTEPVEEPTEPVEEPTEPAEEPTKKPYKVKEYDTNGNLLKESCYNADGCLIGESYFDADGNLRWACQYDATTGATIYCYDSYFPDSGYESEYDEAGRLIRVTFSSDMGDDYGIYYNVEEFKYDESGKVTEWSYDSVGAGRVYVEYEYDAEGNLVEQRFYAPDETGMSTDPDGWFKIDKYEREYDEAGNLISYVKTQCYAGEDCITVEKNEYRYDEEGHLVETVIFETMYDESASYKYEYDSEGKQTGYTYYNGDGDATIYGVVEYDAMRSTRMLSPIYDATIYGVVEYDAASTEETTEPTEETTEPTEETTEPTEETTEPTEGTTEPTEETTEPTEETTEPTEGTTEPTEGTTEPTEGTTEPTEGTTEPTEGTTEPTEGTTEPTGEPTEPTEEPTEPTEEAA